MKIIYKLLMFTCGCVLFLDVSAQESDTLKAEDILKMSLVDLMNIKVVTASKSSQSIKDVSATVRVITEEQIKERGYFTLEEALADLPGFQFRNILGFNSYIFMRGAPSQNNLILLMVDGVQINELNSGGFYAGGQIIMSDIVQIEVVYGPASAIYGTNAVSGIINIITKNPENKKANIGLLAGNFKTGMVSFNFTDYKKSNDFGYSVSGQYKTTCKANLAGHNGDNNWTDDMENFENDISFSAKAKVKKFNAAIIYQEKRSSMTTNFKSVNDIYLDRNTLWDIMFLNAILKYVNDVHKRWLFNSTAYYRNSTVKPNTINAIIKATDTTSGMQIGYYRPNSLIGLENQFNYKPSDRLMVTGGVIGEAEWLSEGFSVTYSNSEDEAPATPSKPPKISNYLFSYYTQLDYAFFKQLSFKAGFRFDYSDYYGQVLVPRMGLVYNCNKVTAKILYNKAFRSPNPWDYKYGTGNSKLKPEKMESFEFNLSFLVKEDLRIGGSVYYNRIKDKLTKETTATTDKWINKDILNTAGFELSGNYFTGNLNVYANYTFNYSIDQDDVFIPEISMHSFNSGFSFSIIKLFNINLRANYLGNRKNPGFIPSTGNNKIEDALIFNGCITYLGLKNCNFLLKVNNILNQEYYHPSNRFDGRYRQPQANFSLSAVYNFIYN